MSDWVKNYKQQVETNERAQQLNIERQQRNDGILATRGRAMWDATVSQIESDVSELEKAFANDASRHLVL